MQDKILVQYPASGEIADIQLVFSNGAFYERVSKFDHQQVEAGEDNPYSYHAVSPTHAQAEVIAHQVSMFHWMKENATESGLVVTPAIKVWSETKYIDETDSFEYFSVVTVEGNTESPFYFRGDSHADDAREFVAAIAQDFQ